MNSACYVAAVAKCPLFEIEPASPVPRTEQCGGHFKRFDEGRLDLIQRLDRVVGCERTGTRCAVGADPFAQQPREVSRNALESHRTEVDETRDSVPFEQKMLGAGVSQARLSPTREPRNFVKRFEPGRGDFPRFVQPLTREWRGGVLGTLAQAHLKA